MTYNFENAKDLIEKAKSSYDLAQDINLAKENMDALESNDFDLIRSQLKKSAERYGKTINELTWLTGDFTYTAQDVSKDKIIFSLSYITNNIPFYVIYENVRDEALKRLFGNK